MGLVHTWQAAKGARGSAQSVARARTLSQRFEAWFPFRSHWPCGGDVLRLQIELLNGPLPLELGLPDLLQRDADDEAAVSLRPIKL